MVLARVEIHGNDDLTEEKQKEISAFLQQMIDYWADEAIERTKETFGEDLVLTVKQ